MYDQERPEVKHHASKPSILHIRSLGSTEDVKKKVKRRVKRAREKQKKKQKQKGEADAEDELDESAVPYAEDEFEAQLPLRTEQKISSFCFSETGSGDEKQLSATLSLSNNSVSVYSVKLQTGVQGTVVDESAVVGEAKYQLQLPGMLSLNLLTKARNPFPVIVVLYQTSLSDVSALR